MTDEEYKFRKDERGLENKIAYLEDKMFREKNYDKQMIIYEDIQKARKALSKLRYYNKKSF